MSDSAVGPRAEDASSPEEVEPSTPTLTELSYGGKDVLWWLKDTLQKGELRIRPALADTEYAGIPVRAVPGAPVDTVYLLDLGKWPSPDMLLDEMRASLTSDFAAVMEDDLCVQGQEDVGSPSPETFARDLERFVMSTVPGPTTPTQVPEAQRAVCSMSTIRAALDGFGEPCFLCDATPCICGRAL